MQVGPAVKLTVVLPWLLLAVMIIYNATLTGSGDGVKAYIGEWDMSVLRNGVAWSDAAGALLHVSQRAESLRSCAPPQGVVTYAGWR